MSIELLPMRQLVEVSHLRLLLHKVHAKLLQVKDQVEDDWTGLTDRQARRKRQNRLSKRAQRK